MHGAGGKFRNSSLAKWSEHQSTGNHWFVWSVSSPGYFTYTSCKDRNLAQDDNARRAGIEFVNFSVCVCVCVVI